MKWARKWWTVNAAMVALTLQVVLGLTSVTFSSKRLLASPCGKTIACGRPCRRKSNPQTADESSARGLFGMMVVVLVSAAWFSSYCNWSGDVSLTFGNVAPGDYRTGDGAGSKRALGMEVVVSYALSLLVTLASYLHRWKNGPVVRDLNRNFRALHRSHPGALESLRWSRPWDGYGRLAAKQTVEVLALGVLWLNLKPFSGSHHDDDGDGYHVGKLISSMGSMLPAAVCLLVSVEIGINFSFIALSLAVLNRSLDTVVKSRTQGGWVMGVQGRTMRGPDCRMMKSMRSRADRQDYLRNLIMQYDKLGDVASTLVQFYSPILLLIIGMHFVLFTMQLFLCYREMSRTTSGSVSVGELGQTLVPLLSAAASAMQIIFVVDTTANFNRKLEDDTLALVSSLTRAIHEDGYCAPQVDAEPVREIDQSVMILSLVVSRVQADTNLYGYFDLDRSLVMTIVASTFSYLIVLIQVM